MDTPCVLYNGALIYDLKADRELVSHSIEPTLAVQLIEHLKATSGIHNIVAESLDKFWAEWVDEDVAYWTRTGGRPPEIGYPSSFFDQPLSKLLIRGNHEELLPILHREWGEHLQFTFSDPQEQWLEVMNIRAGKASAVRWLADYYGVKVENMVAFGDSENDLDMLKTVGLGVAMGNATDAVRAQAKLITLTNRQDGVAVILEELFTQKTTRG